MSDKQNRLGVSSYYRSGFTLIELLIVIAILGILMSVVLASFTDVRARARWEVMRSDMRQIAVAAEMLMEREGLYPCDVAPAVDPGTAPTHSTEPGVTCVQQGLVENGLLDAFPSGPCPGWEYDWENWSHLRALQTANEPVQVVRISLRRNDPGWPNVYYLCILDTYGSTEYECGGRTGDMSFTLGGVQINQMNGKLYCN